MGLIQSGKQKIFHCECGGTYIENLMIYDNQSFGFVPIEIDVAIRAKVSDILDPTKRAAAALRGLGVMVPKLK